MSGHESRYMPRQPRWAVLGMVPVVIGAVWLLSGWNQGVVAGVVSSAPGVILIGAGAAALLWPGGRHVNYYLALASAASILLAPVMFWAFGVDVIAVLLLGGAACSLLAGHLALQQDSLPAGVPVPPHNVSMALKAALDEGFLGFFVACSRIPRGNAVIRDRQQLEALEALAAREHWDACPGRLHRRPDAPDDVAIERVTQSGRRFERLSFASGYHPPADCPAAEGWLEQQRNARMHARVFRHEDGDRPWLLCLHGYRMGTPMADFSLFDIDRLHYGLGLNLLMPILPLHGPRRETLLSGGGFIDGALIRMFHAEAQALWDVRRCLAWLRQQHDAATVGVLGYSLGSYQAALLAAIEPALACVIAGIPLVDIPAVLWRNLPILDRRYMEACGLHPQWLDRVMAPVSPLHLAPRVARERRFILAATGDRIVPPDQPLALWHHWGEPAMHWYHGSHISMRREARAAAFIDDALKQSMAASPAGRWARN